MVTRCEDKTGQGVLSTNNILIDHCRDEGHKQDYKTGNFSLTNYKFSEDEFRWNLFCKKLESLPAHGKVVSLTIHRRPELTVITNIATLLPKESVTNAVKHSLYRNH